MAAGGVVPGFDPVEDCRFRFLPGLERAAAEELLLEGGVEALADGVDAPMSSRVRAGGEVGEDEAVEAAGEVALQAADDLAA